MDVENTVFSGAGEPEEELFDPQELFYEEDIKRLKVAFHCDNCAEPVYEGHEYVEFMEYKLHDRECLTDFLEVNELFKYKEAEKGK